MKNILADIRTTVSSEEKFLEILYRKMLRGERPFQTNNVNPLEWILSAGFYSVYHKVGFFHNEVRQIAALEGGVPRGSN